uniref:Uncharacterized protein n=1 Tax=Romanomermis culicivorax TaxID=13658 RepID=A0A915KUE8_ROMCU
MIKDMRMPIIFSPDHTGQPACVNLGSGSLSVNVLKNSKAELGGGFVAKPKSGKIVAPPSSRNEINWKNIIDVHVDGPASHVVKPRYTKTFDIFAVAGSKIKDCSAYVGVGGLDMFRFFVANPIHCFSY